MRHRSYLRTFAAKTGKINPALRPPRMPVWGLRQAAKDFASLPSSSLTSVHSELSREKRKPLAVSAQRKTELQDDPPTPASAPANSARSERALVHQPVDRLMTSAQSPTEARDTGVSTAIEALLDRRSLSTLSSGLGEAVGPRDGRRTTSQAHPEDAARREIKNAHGPAPYEVVPRPLAASSIQAPRQSTPVERLDVMKAPSQEAPSLRQAPPVLRDTAQNPAATRQVDTKRSGNAVHIGSVDIHIHSSPIPVRRHIVRQPAAPITRGFGASFGLSQG